MKIQHKTGSKILFVASNYPCASKPSEGTFYHRWVKQLVHCGCEVDVFTIKALTFASYIKYWDKILDYLKTPENFYYEWGSVKVFGKCVHLTWPTKAGPNSQIKRLYAGLVESLNEVFSKNQYDLIYLGSGGTLGAAVSKYAICRNIPYICSAIGGDVNSIYNKPDSYFFNLQKGIFLNSKSVICVSEDLERKVQLMTRDRIPTITFYSGVDTESMKPDLEVRNRVRARLNIRKDEIVVLFLGHLKKQKGVFELFQVITQLLREGRKIRLICVGTGDIVDKTMIRFHQFNGKITKKILFTGGIDHSRVSEYLNAANLFVFPSWTEGLPNAVMEACACQLPIIATSVGGIPEIVKNGVNGLLIPPKNTKKLYKAIKEALDNRSFSKRIAKNARKIVVGKFNYNKNGQQLVSKINRIQV